MTANPEGPWKPYQPGDDQPWNLARVVHLHRRAGFGATWQEIQRGMVEQFDEGMVLKPAVKYQRVAQTILSTSS